MKNFTNDEINARISTKIPEHSDKNPIPQGDDPNHYLQAEELNIIVKFLDENTAIVKELMINSNELMFSVDNYIQLYNSEEEFQILYDEGLKNKIYYNSATEVIRIGLLDSDGFKEYNFSEIQKIPQLKTALDNEIVERARVDALKMNKPTTNATSDYVLLADGSTAAKGDLGKNFANTDLVVSQNRKHTGPATLDFGMPFICSNASVRYSGIKPETSKHNDATYNRLLGMDSNGNINEVGIPALTNAMNKATDEQIDAHRIASRKTNETYSIGKSRVDNILPSMVASSLFYPQYLAVTGSGLYINTETQTSSVWLVKVRDELGNPLPLEQQTETLIPYIDVTQTLPSRLGFGFDFTRITNGFYQLRVINNGIPSDLGGNLRVVQELPNTPFLSNLTWKEYNTGDYSNIIKEESGNSGTINLPKDGMIRLMTFPVIFSKASLKDLRSYSIGFDVLSYNTFSGSHYYTWEFGLIDNNNYIQVIASGIEGRNNTPKNFQAILSIERGLVSFTRFDTTVFNATVQLSDTATDYRAYFKCAINAVSGNFRTTIQAQSLIEL